MIKHYIPSWIKRDIKKIIGQYPAGRTLTVRETDTFIVSYPKSGNTWIRFLIGNLIHEEGVDFTNIEDSIPDIYLNADSIMRRLPAPRIIKSHEYFDPRYKKVIYIVRDPRDVVISYWHFAKKQKYIVGQTSLDDFVDVFIQGRLNGFGAWGEHVGSWLGARESTANFLLLRYEDLLSNAKEELRKVASFFGVRRDEVRIKRAIELSSFNRMKEMEVNQRIQWKAIRNSRQEIPFVRSGRSGGWKEVLSDQSASSIQDEWRVIMKKLGYM